MTTGVGVAELLFDEPVPNCPLLLLPQHRTAPEPDRSTHVCELPADTTATPVITSEEGGDMREKLFPVPSWLNAL